ncbi:MAG: hypothetical protein QG608_2584 [Actinomycetota bacterium]|nr:hypothetical protein [Actinomycetota bacterium]
MLTTVETGRRLDALRAVRLNWAETPDDIWEPNSPHVEGLQPEAERALLDGLRDARDSSAACPLGLTLEGRKGVGKSHLLGWARQQANRDGGYFFLVQYLAGTQFWHSAVQGILDGLLRRRDGRPEDQLTHLLTDLADRAGLTGPVREMLTGRNEPTREALDVFLSGLRRLDRQVGLEAQDTVRALVLYGTDGPAAEIGHALLSAGEALEPAEFAPWGIRSSARPAQLVLRDLSRLLSLSGPTVVAIDQIDTLLAPHVRSGQYREESEAQDQADRLLDRIADGLMSLREETRRTLSVLACLPTSWEIIRTQAVDTVADRFRTVPLRDVMPDAMSARRLVASRLTARYEQAGFTAPYPTWPVLPEAFTDSRQFTARGVLRAVDRHIVDCLARGEIGELHHLEPTEDPRTTGGPGAPRPDDLSSFDEEFALLYSGESPDQEPQEKPDQSTEDRLVPELLDTALACLAQEQRAGGHRLERDPRQVRRPDLHARLRLCLDTDTEDELHWAFRAVLGHSARGVQTRIRNARTKSGLTAGSTRRRLVLLRNDPWPSGRVTLRTVEDFLDAGGVVRELSERDLRTLRALRVLVERAGPGLNDWLVSRRPAGGLQILRDVVDDLAALPLPSGAQAPPSAEGETRAVRPEEIAGRENRPGGGLVMVPSPRPAPDTAVGSDAAGGSDTPVDSNTAGPSAGGEPRTSLFDPATVRLGQEVNGGRPVSIPLKDLRKHTVVFAGSGSGKTVLLRRLVEECALRGVSSVVLDVNNDLARLGDPWPEPPESWAGNDPELARAYFEGTEVLLWTPGRASGRALSFRPLPDFAPVRDDPDELADAVAVAAASLEPRARLTTQNTKTEQRRAVLREAVTHFAREGTGTLSDLIELMRDLPDGISGIANAPKLAAETAETLAAARVNDRLFDPGREPTAVGDLLTPSEGRSARVSVVSLAGLASDEERQGFVNQLQMALFGWIKENPARGRPLRGLLVMDEAQTYAPSGRSTACSRSTLALAAQARKYGLGLVFATQSPKGLDNSIPGNASTQFFGFLNAPVQIEAAKAIAASRRGRIDEIGHLKAGQFFTSGEGTPFRKITTPFCLSHHPPEPLTAEEILSKAAGTTAEKAPASTGDFRARATDGELH